MASAGEEERRLRAATAAFELIQLEVRPHLASGGRLWSKGSGGYPSRLRQVLRPLDDSHGVVFATHTAMQLPAEDRVIEHVFPFKRIIIELVDPAQADPRSNTRMTPIAGGPANSPDQLIAIFDAMLAKCWVTPEEHDRLNRAGASLQWDAPDGDGWARYRLANVEAHRLPALASEDLGARQRGSRDLTTPRPTDPTRAPL